MLKAAALKRQPLCFGALGVSLVTTFFKSAARQDCRALAFLVLQAQPRWRVGRGADPLLFSLAYRGQALSEVWQQAPDKT